MYMGGGRADEPYIWTFWWDGYEVRIEVYNGPSNKYTNSIHGKKIRIVERIIIPQNGFDKKDEILKLILEAFSANSDKIITKIECEPKEGDE